MTRFLRTSASGGRQGVSRTRAERSAHPWLEQLEVRAVPNAAPLSRAHAGAFGHGADAIADLKGVQRDLSKLTKDLGTGASATVTADIATLRADVNTIIGDVRGGTDPTADINKAQGDGLTLFADLGTNLTRAVRRDVLAITAAGADVTADLAATPESPADLLNEAQNDLTSLTQILGSNVSPAVSADLNAVQTDLNAIAADLVAGRSVAGDAHQAIRNATRLFRDLNGQLTPNVTVTFASMAFYVDEVEAH